MCRRVSRLLSRCAHAVTPVCPAPCLAIQGRKTTRDASCEEEEEEEEGKGEYKAEEVEEEEDRDKGK